MSFCFEGAKIGQFCFGDVMGRLHGDTLTAGHLGLGILAVILGAILIFVFRQPT